MLYVQCILTEKFFLILTTMLWGGQYCFNFTDEKSSGKGDQGGKVQPHSLGQLLHKWQSRGLSLFDSDPSLLLDASFVFPQ